jgi:hypothetical protein
MPDESLEANTRKLKTLCESDLKCLEVEGRFPQELTKGSKLWAIVSAFAEALLGDTQLVESINSIIRLISTRCIRIDLPGLSSRGPVLIMCHIALLWYCQTPDAR